MCIKKMRWTIKLPMYIALLLQSGLLIYGISNAIFYAWRSAFAGEDHVFLHIWFYLWVDICVFTIFCSILLLNIIVKSFTSVWEVFIIRLYFAAMLLVSIFAIYAILLNMRNIEDHYEGHNASFSHLNIAILIVFMGILISVLFLLAKKYQMPGRGFSSPKELRIVTIQYTSSIVSASMIVMQSLNAINYIHAIRHTKVGNADNILFHYWIAMAFAVTFTYVFLLLGYCLYKGVLISRKNTIQVQ